MKAPLVRVDGQPCVRPPLTDRVTLSRKRNVERTGTHLLHLQGAAVILATNSAAALKASALAVLWRGHDEDQVVDPSCHVDWLRQVSEEARNGTNEAKLPAIYRNDKPRT